MKTSLSRNSEFNRDFANPLFAKTLLIISVLAFFISTYGLIQKIEPFYTYYFLFIWISYILVADSWLHLKTGDSLLIGHAKDFFLFLLPYSIFIWFVFEAFNLRIHNWYYVGGPALSLGRYVFKFLAFATVLPAIFETANLLEYAGIFKIRTTTHLQKPLSHTHLYLFVFLGFLMLALSLIFPTYFYPFIWIGFIFLLDPINAIWKSPSLIEEWFQNNWNRTLQLMLAGMICGFLWEIWNKWAGAKWIYTVPLPSFLQAKLGIFEMPLLGFLGFPFFALECFAMVEFARNLQKNSSKTRWVLFIVFILLFSLAVCWAMSRYLHPL